MFFSSVCIIEASFVAENTKEGIMRIGMIGLGRMGANMVQRLLRGGHEVVVWNRTENRTKRLEQHGAIPSTSPEDLVSRLTGPRVVWFMLPAGDVTSAMIRKVSGYMDSGDVIIDGGNTHYKEDIDRKEKLDALGIHYIDVGTSGGVWGLERGYCLMIGGPEEPVRYLEPVFRTLAPGRGNLAPVNEDQRHPSTAQHGYLHCGPAGSGHFVKMVHNGIEYGIMQAYAEGFNLLKSASETRSGPTEHFDLELDAIAELWRRGSVIGSWLLDLTAAALAETNDLGPYEGIVHDSGEGRWTIQAGLDLAVPLNALSASLFARFNSRNQSVFADKLLAAMRFQFGGHRES